MAEIIIDVDKKVETNSFYSSSFLVALCARSRKNNNGDQIIKQATVFFSCRDYLHDTIRNYIYQSAFEAEYRHKYVHGENPDININKFRLLITSNLKPQTFERKLELGIKILNLYSKEAGFQRTTLEKVQHPIKKHCWMLVGDKQWIRNPHLLSMVTLTLRIATDPEGYITVKDVKSKDIVERWYKDLTNSNDIYDDHLLMKCYNKLFLIIKHHKELFKDYTLQELYTMKAKENFHSEGGIYALCTCNTSHYKLNNRARSLFKKNKLL